MRDMFSRVTTVYIWKYVHKWFVVVVVAAVVRLCAGVTFALSPPPAPL